MTRDSKDTTDFRLPTAAKWAAPRAVADGVGGIIIPTAEVAAPPERAFRLFTTSEVECWWGHPDYYRWTDWKADLRSHPPPLTTIDRFVLGLIAQFVRPRRAAKLAAVLKPATLLRFHKALVDRKYRRLWGAN